MVPKLLFEFACQCVLAALRRTWQTLSCGGPLLDLDSHRVLHITSIALDVCPSTGPGHFLPCVRLPAFPIACLCRGGCRMRAHKDGSHEINVFALWTSAIVVSPQSADVRSVQLAVRPAAKLRLSQKSQLALQPGASRSRTLCSSLRVEDFVAAAGVQLVRRCISTA